MKLTMSRISSIKLAIIAVIGAVAFLIAMPATTQAQSEPDCNTSGTSISECMNLWMDHWFNDPAFTPRSNRSRSQWLPPEGSNPTGSRVLERVGDSLGRSPASHLVDSRSGHHHVPSKQALVRCTRSSENSSDKIVIDCRQPEIPQPE